MKRIIALGLLISLNVFANDDSKVVLAETIYSLVPPFVAVLLALVTKRLLTSILIGIFSGAAIAAINPSHTILAASMQTFVNTFNFFLRTLSDSSNLRLLLFVSCMMVFVAFLITGGGLQAIIEWMGRRISKHNRRSTKLLTIVMGVLLFIDDYANTLIVGTALRPMSDQARISREKLAFIVDATSAPVAGIAFISTWIGYEIGLFSDAAKTLGIEKDGYSIFFDVFQYRFYCFLMIAFLFIHVLMGRDFGPMLKAEKRALNVRLKSRDEVHAQDVHGTLSFSVLGPDSRAFLHPLTAILPLIVLFSFLFLAFWVDGGGMVLMETNVFSVFSLSKWRLVMSASSNSVSILGYASMVGAVTALVCNKLIARIPSAQMGKVLVSGIKNSFLPMLILVLAWTLKSTCDELKTGQYLVGLLGGGVSPLWFPALVFIVASATGFATGSSWGTMALLIPLTAPLAFELDGQTYGLITMVSLGAILDGAIFGDHCSPISDTTVMSSIATECNHIQHVRTQMPYALLVAFVALLCGYVFVPATGLSPWIGIVLGMVMIVGVLLLIGRNPVDSAHETKD